ncbi:MAG: hypothetical protein K2H92_08740 [Bacteroidaceae bacterium]|nr:hypothetical protein [Bacteroidaceae bacterium]
MKRVLFFLLLPVFSYTLMAQSAGPSKKCPTCGLSLGKCKYRGTHTKPTKPQTPVRPTPSKPVAQQSTPSKPTRQGQTISQATGHENNHGWVDLGLSVKWATCNVGASSPGDYGGHYAWGETRTKSNYDRGNCFDCLDSTGDNWGTYKIGGKTQITPSSGHDTARENWGGTWRMPTYAELEELSTKCQWTWTSREGHDGYLVTGSNGNSIFLPAAGWHDGMDSCDMDENGLYWSSTLGSSASYDACYLSFDSSYHCTDDDGGRSYGLSVRPVTE